MPGLLLMLFAYIIKGIVMKKYASLLQGNIKYRLEKALWKDGRNNTAFDFWILEIGLFLNMGETA